MYTSMYLNVHLKYSPHTHLPTYYPAYAAQILVNKSNKPLPDVSST